MRSNRAGALTGLFTFCAFGVLSGWGQTVSLSPSSANLYASQTQQFSANVSGSTNTNVTWSVAQAGAGTISTTGLYTAPAAIPVQTTVTITATSVANTTKSASGTVSLTPLTIQMNPSSANLWAGQTQQFSAAIQKSNNTSVAWSVAPSTGGSVSGSGLYTPPSVIPAQTTATVTAASSADPTKTASATVTVIPLTISMSPSSANLWSGQTQQFSATIQKSNNTAVTWSIDPADRGSISAAGVYTPPPAIPSQTTVTVIAASAADSSKTVSATVTLIPLTISLSPSTANLNAGQTQTFSAQIQKNNNTGVTWSISPPVGNISASGVYTAPAIVGSQRTVTVVAASAADPTKTASSTVTLLSPITVSPATVSLSNGQTQQFTATVTGLGNTAITWTTSPQVGTISSSGFYTAPALIASPQTVTVIASSVQDQSKQASATVTLPVVTVTTAPATASLTGGQTQQFTASVSGTPNMSVIWTVIPNTGTIGATGLYTTPAAIAAANTVSVIATSVAAPAKSGASAVSLVPVGVILAPATVSLSATQAKQFTATVTGTANTAVTWSISPAGTGTITAAGLYAAPAIIPSITTVTVTATSQADNTKSAAAVVTLSVPISISVTPDTAPILAGGQTVQFAAVVTGAANTTVTWSVSPAGAGSITAGGLYSAPANIPAEQPVTITATSVADSTKSASIQINLVTTTTIGVTPAMATLYAGQTQQFQAAVAGSGNTAVVWTTSPATGAGTVDGRGLFTAPPTVPGNQAVTVIATSVADATKTSSAAINLISSGQITSIAPGFARAGDVLDVTITGAGTTFVQGTTAANFGPGISVGGAAEGSFGPVLVNSAASGVATLTINRTAALAVRTATIKTDSSVITLANALTLTEALPRILFDSPRNLSFTNISPATVSGTVEPPSATVSVNGLQAAPGGHFVLPVPLVEGNNTLMAVALTPSGLANTASLRVTLDTTPPRVAITSPQDGVSSSAASVSVSGVVNDLVVGTVSDQQATVTVNGVQATVLNRTFVVPGIPLVPGDNTITAVATDRSGNSGTTAIVLRRLTQSKPEIRLISGNNQSGIISTLLPQPLVVSLVDAAGSPQLNKPVIFKIVQNDGSLTGAAATSFQIGSVMASLVVNTNARGQASVGWLLGTRSGAGNNRVEASALGFDGTAVFVASSSPASVAQINVDAGNGQTGATGQDLAYPFVAVVMDAGHNRLANVPVTFTVVNGGGSIGGQQAVTQNTDSDGRAQVLLTLGTTPGVQNNVVNANYPSSTCGPASFSANARSPGNPSATQISGVVLDNASNPVPNVTMRLYQPYQGSANNVPVQVGPSVITDAQGQFRMSPAPIGKFKLMADGGTVQPGVKIWPVLEYDIVTVAGQNNTLGTPIYLLPIDTAHQLCISATSGGVLTLPQVPGFSLTVAPGSATFPGGARSGCISVTPVHLDKVPMPPAFGQQPYFIVTIQPPGVLLSPPAPITIPNSQGLKPRQVTELYSFDHDLNSFVSIGTATVSDDGFMVKSDPGVGVLKTGWHGGGTPPPPTCAGTCPPCKNCVGQDCQANTSLTGTRISPFTCCFQGQEWTDHDLDYNVLLRVCPNRVQKDDRDHEIDGCSIPQAAIDIFFPFGTIQDPVNGHNFAPGTISSTAFGADQTGHPTPVQPLPCNLHDVCYQTCGNTQAQCDQQLFNNAISICNRGYPSDVCPFTGTDSYRCYSGRVTRGYFTERADCSARAGRVLSGLQLAGGFAYENRQSQYCKCCR